MGNSFEIAVAPLFCGLVPRRMWLSLDGLDENFRVGMFEDDDFSLRVRRAGFQVVLAEDCFIHHFGSGSFAKLPYQESLRIFDDNRRIFEEKWHQPWVKHRLRAGVRSNDEEPHFAPQEFLAPRREDSAGGLPSPILRRLRPGSTRAGSGFNLQPCGGSAITIDCWRATPGTTLQFEGQPLQTDFVNPNCMTALVPPALLARTGRFHVSLLNDNGESNQLEFVVT
jgi:hypothetical protein